MTEATLRERLEKVIYSSPEPMHGPLEDGFYACDMHVHSNHSHEIPYLEKYSPLTKMVLAFEKGMHYFTLTDHDTFSGVMELQDKLVSMGKAGEAALDRFIPGLEINTWVQEVEQAIHINVYGLTHRQWKDIRKLYCYEEHNDIVYHYDELREYLDDQGLPYQYNHPIYKSIDPGQLRDILSSVFPFVRGKDDHPLDMEGLVDLIPQFPMTEVNGSRIGILNDIAEYHALANNIPITGGTDDHFSIIIGTTYSVAQGENWQDYLANIWAGKGGVVRHDADDEFARRRSSDVIDIVLGGSCDTTKYLGMLINMEFKGKTKGIVDLWNPKFLPLIRKPLTKLGASSFINSQHIGLPEEWLDAIQKGEKADITKKLEKLKNGQGG